MKAMAPNPDDRYLSADEMLADLEEFRKNPNINFDYSASEFVPEDGLDDDRTQVRPVHTGSRPSGERRRPEEYAHSYEEDYPDSVSRRGRGRHSEDEYASSRRDQRYYDEDDDYSRRGPVWPIVLAAVAVLLFVGLVVYFLVNTVFSSLWAPAETTLVPELVGKVYEEIKDDTDLLGRFTLVEGDTVANEAEAGTIIEQDPKEGSEVGEAVTEITVTISGGPDTVTMPPLDNMDYQEACRLLRERGLKPVVPPEYQNHETVEEGRIISYTPEEGLELPPATEVYMVVSRGPAVKELEMPELVNMTKDRALTEIENKNLNWKDGYIKEEYDDTVEAGKVISQYPTEKTKVTEGTVVNLVISKGPDPSAQTPDPPATDPGTNTGTDPGTTTPEPKPVTKTTHISLNGYEGEVDVRVLMDGAQIFAQSVDASMNTGVDVPVQGTTGMGVKELAIYINGVASGTAKVNFDE